MPKKSLGQNFLRERKYVQQFVNTLKLSHSDTILEIGPGEGAVTGLVLNTIIQNNIENIKYTAIELDRNLANRLVDNYRTEINFTVLNENFLDSNLSTYTNIKIFGSIPYYISSPILHKILFESDFAICSLIVQKEFGEKLIYKESKTNYWSLLCLDYNIEIVTLIPNTAFYPVPKVDSIILKLIPKTDKKINDMKSWSKFLHHLFLHQRKMIKKNFSTEALSLAGIDGTLRPSQLTISQVLDLFKSYKN